MSDFIAEARIIVRPDTTKFAAELQAQLASITRTPITIPVVAAASGSVAAAAGATGALAAQQREAAVATQMLGVETARTTLSTGRLTAAQTAAEVAARKLAFSQEAVVGAASAVSAAQITLSRATAAVAASQTALGKVTRATDVATVSLIVHTEQLALAEKDQAVSALAAARAEANRAGAMGAAGKAAGASGAAFLGLRGAVLTSGAVFLGATVLIQGLKQSIEEAIDAEDTFRRTTFLLGEELAGRLATEAVGIGQAFAIDDDDVLKFETQVGKILKAVGFADERTAQFSAQVVRLAADMAAFNRVPVETTLKAITLGLAGNTRSLKQYGVLLDSAAVKQTAMAQTGKSNAAELTRQELILARYTLILRDAGFQQGAFADQADSLTAQSQRLSVNFRELQETIGKGLLPVVGGLVRGLNDAFVSLNKTAGAAKNFARELPVVGDEIAGLNVGGLVGDFVRLNAQAVALGPLFAPIAFGMKLFGDETEETSKKLTVFDKIAGSIAQSLGGLSAALDKVVAGVPSVAERSQLDLILSQAAGDQDAELAILRQQEERQQAFLEKLLEEPAITQKALELQKKAASNLARTRDQIQAIIRAQEAAGAQAEQAAKSLTDAARRAAEAAQQEFLARQELARQQAQNRIAEAANSPALADDIKRQNQFSSLIRVQIAAIKKSSLDQTAKKAALAALRAILIGVNGAIDGLIATQKENRAKSLALARQATTDILGQRLQLAELRGDKDAILTALNRAIADARKRIRAAKTVAERLDEQIALQELINQKNDLLAQKTQDGNQAAKFFFEQLQAQQGFAANLLGNLIPSGQTAGLVGIPSPASAGKAGVSGDIVQAALGARSAAQEGKAATSPSAGQASTTNEILRRILRVLESLNRGAETPEANYGAAMGLAIMTGGGGNTETM